MPPAPHHSPGSVWFPEYIKYPVPPPARLRRGHHHPTHPASVPPADGWQNKDPLRLCLFEYPWSKSFSEIKNTIVRQVGHSAPCAGECISCNAHGMSRVRRTCTDENGLLRTGRRHSDSHALRHFQSTWPTGCLAPIVRKRPYLFAGSAPRKALRRPRACRGTAERRS